MKILFIGHGLRGVECLRALAAEPHEIKAVIVQHGTATDNSMTDSSVYAAARGLQIPVFEPQKINDTGFISSLRALGCDIAVIAAYDQILRQPFIDLFPHGVLNLHGGKLPEYRGGSPIFWQIIKGEKKGFCSIIQVDEGIDTGAVLAERNYDIGPNETGAEIRRRASAIFPPLLLETLRRIERDECRAVPQDESKARYFCQRSAEDSRICWQTMTDVDVHNLIRAMNAENIAPAFSCTQDKKVQLMSSRLLDETYMGRPGKIAFRKKEGVVVICSNRGILILEAALAGEPKQEAWKVLREFCGGYFR